MKTLLLTGYFLIQCADLDNGKYNILFEQVNSGINKAHNMVAYTTENPNFKIGQILNLRITAECEQGFQVAEGNGKNSKWAPEDDWIYVGKSYICNAIEVTYESNKTLSPCESYSRYCNICKD